MVGILSPKVSNKTKRFRSVFMIIVRIITIKEFYFQIINLLVIKLLNLFTQTSWNITKEKKHILKNIFIFFTIRHICYVSSHGFLVQTEKITYFRSVFPEWKILQTSSGHLVKTEHPAYPAGCFFVYTFLNFFYFTRLIKFW